MNRTSALALIIICTVSLCTVFASVALAVDADTDSWTSKASMREPRAHLGAAAVNGKIYVIGGDLGHENGFWTSKEGFSGEVSITNEEYDTTNSKWSLKASMPTVRAVFGVAVYQNKIYCIGGYYAITEYNETGPSGFTYFNTGANEVYDPATDTWENKTEMPVPSTYSGSKPTTANVVNGKIYVLCNGVNNVYDPETDSWTTKTAPPYQITGYSSVVVDDKIWVIGASSTSGSQANAFFQIYNPQTDSWEKGASGPTYGSTAAMAVTTGVYAPKRIYIFEETTTRSYDPATDSWTTSSGMPAARILTGVAVVDDTVYVMGGRSGSVGAMSPSVAIDQYTPIGYSTPEPTASPTVSPSPVPAEPEFPIAIVAAAVVVAVIVIAVIAVVLKRR